jgi:rhodanese-related sulfurtransferase
MLRANLTTEEPGMRKAISGIVVALVVAGMGYLLFAPAKTVTVVDSAGVLTAQKQGAQVIDVRTAGEFQLGHIPGAINVPLVAISNAAAKWNRNAAYVIYCATGSRSAQAIQILTSMGFTRLDHFSTGFNSWTGQIEKGATPTASGAPAATTVQTSGKPLVIEFYTDT